MKPFSILTSAALAAGLSMGAAPVLADAHGMVRDINVAVNIDAATGANALSYYPDIAADLTRMLADELPVSGAADGYTVNVTVDSMTLDGDTALPDTREFNTMSGSAAITGPGADGPTQSFDIDLTAETAMDRGPEATDKPDVEDFYIAMLAGFAEYVAQNAPEELREKE